jgi:hypothetical protein
MELAIFYDIAELDEGPELTVGPDPDLILDIGSDQ